MEKSIIGVIIYIMKTDKILLSINKKDLKQITITLGILFILFLMFMFFKKPTVYDCMKLGSDDVRYDCLDKYYPNPKAIKIKTTY